MGHLPCKCCFGSINKPSAAQRGLTTGPLSFTNPSPCNQTGWNIREATMVSSPTAEHLLVRIISPLPPRKSPADAFQVGCKWSIFTPVAADAQERTRCACTRPWPAHPPRAIRRPLQHQRAGGSPPFSPPPIPLCHSLRILFLFLPQPLRTQATAENIPSGCSLCAGGADGESFLSSSSLSFFLP